MASTSESVDIPAVRTASARSRSAAAERTASSSHLQALLAQQDAFIGAHHPGDQIHARPPLVLARHLPTEFGRPNLLEGQPRVPNRLVQHHLRLEVVHGIGTIERANGEILLAELVLRQQRAEHEDRIVAALPGFGVVRLRKVSAASLARTHLRSGNLRTGGLHRGVLVERHADCIFEG